MSAQAVPMKRTIAPKINGARIHPFYTVYRSLWGARGRKDASRRGLTHSSGPGKVAWHFLFFTPSETHAGRGSNKELEVVAANRDRRVVNEDFPDGIRKQQRDWFAGAKAAGII